MTGSSSRARAEEAGKRRNWSRRASMAGCIGREAALILGSAVKEGERPVRTDAIEGKLEPTCGLEGSGCGVWKASSDHPERMLTDKKTLHAVGGGQK